MILLRTKSQLTIECYGGKELYIEIGKDGADVNFGGDLESIARDDIETLHHFLGKALSESEEG